MQSVRDISAFELVCTVLCVHKLMRCIRPEASLLCDISLV